MHISHLLFYTAEKKILLVISYPFHIFKILLFQNLTLMNKVTQQICAHYHARSNTHATNILTDTLALTCMLQYTCTITDAHTRTRNITLDKMHAQILKHQTIMQQHALNRMHSTASTQHHAFNSIDVTT